MATGVRRVLFGSQVIKLRGLFCSGTARNISATSHEEETANHAREQKTGTRETYFGYERVTENEKAEKVQSVFESVADKYDIMNDVMSFGLHRIWKDIFMHRLGPTPGTKLLDVAGGTGDIAFRFLHYTKDVEQGIPSASQSGDEVFEYPAENLELMSAGLESLDPESLRMERDREQRGETDNPRLVKSESHVTVCDFSQKMLDVGKLRAERLGIDSISWLCADAMDLPVEDNSFDAYTIVFGIRNVARVDKALSEAYRVLRPGGRFLCMEFSHMKNPTFQWLYDQYSFNVIPPLGVLVAGDWHSYQYLVESIRRWMNQDKFTALIEDAGFRMVTCESLLYGGVAIHSGFKL